METTILSIVSLAFVNAINPCALAALVMVLISVLLGNEEKRHKVLLGGFAFIAAIFIGYFNSNPRFFRHRYELVVACNAAFFKRGNLYS